MSITQGEWYGGAEQRTLSGDLTVSFKLARLWDITPDTSGRTVTLPDARRHRTGGTWAIVNRGTDSIDVDDAGGSPVATLADDQGVILGLLDNSTAAGVWTAMVRSVGVVDNPALGVLGYVFSGETSPTGTSYLNTREWNPQLDAWSSKTDAATGHKQGASFAIAASGYATAGNSSATGITSAHHQYDPDTWTARTSLTTTATRICGCALDDGSSTKGYVFMGYAASSTSDATYVYTAPATDSWATTTAQPDGSAYGSACNINDFGHRVGGFAHDTTTDFDHYQLDVTATDVWASKTVILHGRMYFSMTGLGSNGYVFGGSDSSSATSSTTYDETNIYSQSSDSWTQGAEFPLGKVAESAVVVLDSIHYVCGGQDHTTLPGALATETQSYDSTLDAWAAETDMLEARRYLHNMGQPIQA